MKLKRYVLLITCCVYNLFAFAQGGGPPMLTTDPGTPEKGDFEINTSFNSEITNVNQFSLPMLDANYGANEHTQLTLQSPYLITSVVGDNKRSIGSFGYPILGVKYRFLDQEKDSVSVSVFPQVQVAGNATEYLLPFEAERIMGKWTVGEEIAYYFIEPKSQNMFNGTVVGYYVSKKSQVLVECFLEYNFNTTVGTNAFVNCGYRYNFNKTFILLASAGTQFITPATQQRQYFFSFLGLQMILKTKKAEGK
jgi:hypothetical protein